MKKDRVTNRDRDLKRHRETERQNNLDGGDGRNKKYKRDREIDR
jgi:hypothetical protein